jgi:hypothetical protein
MKVKIIPSNIFKYSDFADIIIIIGNISNNIFEFSYQVSRYLHYNPNSYILLVPQSESLIQSGYNHPRYIYLNSKTIILNNVSIHGSIQPEKNDAEISVSYYMSHSSSEFSFDSLSEPAIIEFG